MTQEAELIDPANPVDPAPSIPPPNPVTVSPLYATLVVRKDPSVTMIGAMHVPDSAQAPVHVGTVVEVGEGYPQEDGSVRPMKIEEGMRVLWHPHAGVPLPVGFVGKSHYQHIILREEEILCEIHGEIDIPDPDLPLHAVIDEDDEDEDDED